MTTLPFDFHRCEPIRPDDKCRQCLRWGLLPDQTFGHWTPIAIDRSDSLDNGCTYPSGANHED